jgi:hypothetical protein
LPAPKKTIANFQQPLQTPPNLTIFNFEQDIYQPSTRLLPIADKTIASSQKDHFFASFQQEPCQLQRILDPLPTKQ